MSAEIADLSKVRKRHARKRIAFSIVSVIAIIAFVWLVFLSPYFVVKKIVVTGEFYASSNEIIEAAGIPQGQILALLNADGVSRRVGAIPAVLNVEVRRVWPDQVILAVRERTPIAVAETDNGWTFGG